MRIKFKKGFTPDAIGTIFEYLCDDNNIILGTVNIYVQEIGADGKGLLSNDYIEIEPGEVSSSKYQEYVADLRRSKFKVV